MTPEELRTEIARDPLVCKRCNLRECTCWGFSDDHIAMAPFGKANLVAMKLAYRGVDWDVKPRSPRKP